MLGNTEQLICTESWSFKSAQETTAAHNTLIMQVLKHAVLPYENPSTNQALRDWKAGVTHVDLSTDKAARGHPGLCPAVCGTTCKAPSWAMQRFFPIFLRAKPLEPFSSNNNSSLPLLQRVQKSKAATKELGSNPLKTFPSDTQQPTAAAMTQELQGLFTHRIFSIGREPQGSSSPVPKWMARRGIKPTTLMPLAPCSDHQSSVLLRPQLYWATEEATFFKAIKKQHKLL